MLTLYLPIVILLVLALVFAASMATVVSDGVGPRRWNRAKLDAYECGIEPTPLPAGRAGRFPVKFYLTAMLFIVFDVEIIFLYPWAQSAVQLGVFGLIEIGLFVLTVGAVYVYVWRRGGLDWN
ncbi:NADH-quinone oxidoreductase subunit A [Nakamurella leprariae]|uniref:NADH-quinone oxidoreductase subunit A n=1 Tax=Nakamurella leprariae TaxID=2803911 RepID=UPI0038B3FD70